jgi:hypothetical protein
MPADASGAGFDVFSAAAAKASGAAAVAAAT